MPGKELDFENGEPVDRMGETIVCEAADCEYRHETSELRPTLVGRCPTCGGPLTYADDAAEEDDA